MLRIGIDARYLAAGFSGIGTYSEHLVRALARLESPYEYVLFVHAEFSRPLDLAPNWRVVRLAADPMSFRTFFGDVAGQFEDADLDLLHIHYPLVPSRWKGPTVLSLHDLQPFTVPGFTGGRPLPLRVAYDLFYRWEYPHAFDRAAVILTPSRATRDDLYRTFPDAARRTLVTPYGLDPSYLEPPPPAEQVENVLLKYRIAPGYLLFLGSTRPNKNLPNMLRAFARWRAASGEAERRFVLVLARDRFWPESERLIAQLGIAGAVRVLDQVSPAEKRALYHGAGALAFATRAEGFGFPVLEAQACGCPVVTCEDASLGEIAGDGALFVDPDDPDDIATGISCVFDDDEVREKLIAAGRANCRRYTWEECARRVHDVYEHLFDPDSYLVTDSRDPASVFYAQSSRVIVE